jgi:hypothetical protein
VGKSKGKRRQKTEMKVSTSAGLTYLFTLFEFNGLSQHRIDLDNSLGALVTVNTADWPLKENRRFCIA